MEIETAAATPKQCHIHCVILREHITTSKSFVGLTAYQIIFIVESRSFLFQVIETVSLRG
jgi:hypothetical protein